MKLSREQTILLLRVTIGILATVVAVLSADKAIEE